MILFQYIRKYYLIFRFKELIRGIVCIIIILYRGNKMATEFLIACILFTIQIIEILRAKILKQILLRLFCRERVGIRNIYLDTIFFGSTAGKVVEQERFLPCLIAD